MNPNGQLRFAISDRINGVDVTPNHVPLALIGTFQEDVSDFLKGSRGEVDARLVQISIEGGSLSFLASGLLAAAGLWSDLGRLAAGEYLERIDAKRANVVERWQEAVARSPKRHYLVSSADSRVHFSVDFSSNFRKNADSWVQVEKYLYGNVIDMGGKKTANVHIEVEDLGILKVESTQELLSQGDQNRLYRPALLRVAAEENLTTGKLQNLRLISFEPYQPTFDQSEHEVMLARGEKAWSAVPNVSTWLERLRSGQA